ncbi:MAG: Holliday junction branch migration protein RuvA [Rhodothermales bacterium]|nr:Holliday junction branch migration protein RuvA [Rhodothermales bacterium]
MIIHLSGTLLSKKPTHVIIDVSGVGYEVLIPTSTYERLPGTDEKVLLHTYHHVREDAEQLFGFAEATERDVFRVMLGVTGIGPKLALAALSAFRPAELRDHVTRGEVGALTAIPGVGRKTAERLIVELKDKFGQPGLLTTSGNGAADGVSVRADAVAALEALGLTRAAAEKSVTKTLQSQPDLSSVEDLIREALKSG